MAKINWQMDPAHTEVNFKVRHMMVSNVNGEFRNFEAHMETEDHDFSTAKVSFSADVNSITTRVEQRDNHLKSPDFFDAETYPKLSFESTKIINKGDNQYQMEGNLTMRGVTKPVTLDVDHIGLLKDDYGFMRAGFEISGKVKRLDFGLKYNPAMEAGGVVVGNDVKITVNAEFTYKA